MRVLMLCATVAPLTREGGVAEGVGALARTLAQMGCEVTVAVPASHALDLRAIALQADATCGGRARHGALPGGARLLVLDGGTSPRAGAWGSDTDDLGTAEHFARYCDAVVAHVEARAAAGEPYAVVHAHDWPGAPALHLLAASPASPASRPATVLTIHNLAFQGTYPSEARAFFAMRAPRGAVDPLHAKGGVNFLRAGIVRADMVLTVSPTYAREIVTPAHGELLHAELAARGATLRGIVNGIDDALWDPASCPHLAARFDARDPSGKRACKAALLAELGLSSRAGAPLAVCLGRLDAQKGSDVLAAALAPLAAQGVTTIVAGRGMDEPTRAIEIAARASAPASTYLGYVDEPLAHRLVAAADLVLLPSRFEPCGIVQMYAQRHGALPVARRTGGLADTIVDLDAAPLQGTGILFDALTPAALVEATMRGVAVQRSPAWPEIQARLLGLKLGWTHAAMLHRMLYADLAMRRARG